MFIVVHRRARERDLKTWCCRSFFKISNCYALDIQNKARRSAQLGGKSRAAVQKQHDVTQKQLRLAGVAEPQQNAVPA